ncbi:MAG: zinc-dependent metalloprotease [Bacteroidota bacterium]
MSYIKRKFANLTTMFKKIIFPVALAVFLFSCVVYTKSDPKQANAPTTFASTNANTTTNVSQLTPKADTTKKAPKPKPYKDVITEKTLTDNGFITLHRVDEKYYFEIPDSLLDRDMLLVTRVAKGAVEAEFYGGDEVGEFILRFSRGPKDKIFLKMISHLVQAKDSTENGMRKALENSSVQPIVASFPVSAYSPDSSGVVIDMTTFLNSDNNLLYFSKGAKTLAHLGALDLERSYIVSVKSFPINLEIETMRTYNKEASKFGANTYQLNTSLVLLPKTPMGERAYDQRVGYFFRMFGDLDANSQKFEAPFRINRWRMEPKPEDVEKYRRGELVEPAKPIIYYIDPATPKKWVPFLIQGVNDWQIAFQKAGFKNAIYALEAPKNDSSWNLYDATHNAIIYKASSVANASGPHVQDPRSGEILETHIEWYHNVMSLLHDWYMVQAGPNDPRARGMQFDDKLMGQLIRFVSSHEVGHTLGLQHNFGASSTIPVEKLRDKNWVEENGFCPSIMDYARFNYVAQPEDNISEKGIFPRIGVYDEFAIEWGYRWFDQFKTRKEEETYLNNWVIKKTSSDNRLLFLPEVLYGLESRAQSEDLGDDPILASSYGIKNLKRVMSQLPEWTKEPNQNYDELRSMRSQVVNQYTRYIYHVARNIGGINYTNKVIEQPGRLITPTPSRLQKAAVKFLADELLINEPEWLSNYDQNTKYFSMIAGYSPELEFITLKDTILGKLLSYNTLVKLSWFESTDPKGCYAVKDYLTDLENQIWENLRTKKQIGSFERFTEESYVSKLVYSLNVKPADPISSTDLATLIRMHAQSVYKIINNAIPLYKDELSKTHLERMQKRLKQALSGAPSSPDAPTNKNKNADDGESLLRKLFNVNSLLRKNPAAFQFENCWEDNVVFDSNN